MRTVWMSVAALMSALVFAGCSVDVDVDNAKGTKSSRNGKTDGEARRNKTAADELEAKRDAEEASYSPTNAAPLYVTKPMAWFKETDEKMRFTRQKLLEAQARISVIYGKYDRQVKGSGDKAKGYLELLEKAEKARTDGKKNGWPVAFDQWVIDGEEALDAKIAEINAAMGKNRVLGVEDMALYNAAKTALKNAREKLVRFDDAYSKFKRIWDMYILGKLKGIPVELEKSVNEAIDTTEIFINEWNRVK